MMPPRSLHALINTDDPAWPLVQQWIARARQHKDLEKRVMTPGLREKDAEPGLDRARHLSSQHIYTSGKRSGRGTRDSYGRVAYHPPSWLCNDLPQQIDNLMRIYQLIIAYIGVLSDLYGTDARIA